MIANKELREMLNKVDYSRLSVHDLFWRFTDIYVRLINKHDSGLSIDEKLIIIDDYDNIYKKLSNLYINNVSKNSIDIKELDKIYNSMNDLEDYYLMRREEGLVI